MNPKKYLVFSAISGVVWIGLTVYISIRDRKEAEARVKRMTANRANHEAYMKQLDEINSVLGKQLEAAEFWAIVLSEDF